MYQHLLKPIQGSSCIPACERLSKLRPQHEGYFAQSGIEFGARPTGAGGPLCQQICYQNRYPSILVIKLEGDEGILLENCNCMQPSSHTPNMKRISSVQQVRRSEYSSHGIEDSERRRISCFNSTVRLTS